ncbi:MAG: zinc ribbon domain-containing protein [Candidatus Methanomethylicaceae archaeon]
MELQKAPKHNIIEYKAKLAGLNIIPVKAKDTSSLCPKCRVKPKRV